VYRGLSEDSLERGQGDSVKEIIDYWGDASIEEIYDQVVAWKAKISQSRSIAEMAEFWDTHDATDFDDQTHEVTMEFDLRVRRHYVAIDPELLTRLRKLAQARGISLESLANFGFKSGRWRLRTEFGAAV